MSSILEGRPHTGIALDRSKGAAGNVYDLASLLASLAALGYAVDLSRWDTGTDTPAYPREQRGLTAKISGANAKPKSRMTADPLDDHRPAPAGPPARSSSPAATSTRFAIEETLPAPSPSSFEPCTNGAIDATKDTVFSTRMNAQGSSSNAPEMRAGAASPEEPPGSAGAQPVTPARLATPEALRAFQTAQENLLALQRLAAQTADVHRQFLEGQERIQQTFAKLLEQGERAGIDDSPSVAPQGQPLTSRGRRPGEEADLSGPFGTSFANSTTPERAAREIRNSEPPIEKSAHSSKTTPAAAFLGPSDHRDRNGAADRPLAPGPRSFAPAPVAPAKSPISDAADAAPDVPDANSVARTVIEVVSEKTGYPPDVLGLDMKLDADLGIDSIKRVEILSALHERLPALPTLAPEQVGAWAL